MKLYYDVGMRRFVVIKTYTDQFPDYILAMSHVLMKKHILKYNFHFEIAVLLFTVLFHVNLMNILNI